MHLVDGILSFPVLVSGTVVAIIGIRQGLRSLDAEQVPRTALLTALFFLASLIHVPIGPSNAHLFLLGLVGLLLGWLAFPAIFIGLLLQAAFFGYGGLSVLGVNTLNMALPAVLCAGLMRPFFTSRHPTVIALSGFALGALTTVLAALLVALSLGLSGREFHLAAKLLFVSHLPVMLVEGILTAAIVILLYRVAPDQLRLLENHE